MIIWVHTYILQRFVKAATVAPVNNTYKKVIFKNCVTFINCIIEINNTQVDNAQDIDIVNREYSLREYSDVCSKPSGSSWQYYRDIPAVDSNNNIIDFPANKNKGVSFKFKQQITVQTGNGRRKNIELMVPLKYLNNF